MNRPCQSTWLVWGWRTICVFLSFAARVQGSVIGVVRGLVLDFGGDEGLFDASFGGSFGIWLSVTDGESSLILGYRWRGYETWMCGLTGATDGTVRI